HEPSSTATGKASSDPRPPHRQGRPRGRRELGAHLRVGARQAPRAGVRRTRNRRRRHLGRRLQRRIQGLENLGRNRRHPKPLPSIGDRMTTLYKAVKIESAEQAEALPEGTIISYLLAPTVLISDEERVWVDGEDTVMTGADLYAARDVWTVLAPVEAEEETAPAPFSHRTRYVTPWEET